MKAQWKRLMGALVVLAIGAAAFAPVGGLYRSATRPSAAGQLRAVGASTGLGQASQAADEKPADGGPIVIQPDHMDVSPPLRDITPVDATPADPTLMRFQEREILPGHEQEGTYSEIDAVLQNWHGPLAMPSPIQNWDGINNVGYGVRPPDTVGDVGPNHYVQWVNLRFQIWNKTGTSLYGPALGNTLWSGFGGKCQTYNNGDPVVLYDHLADRWVMMQFALGTVGDGTSDLLCFAVSQTPDPTGSWHRYSYTWPYTYMPDYPKMGLWPDGYYVSVNQFNDAASASRGAGVLAMERTQMLTGATAQAVYFNGYAYNSNYSGMLPADWEGATPPPSGAPIPFAEWDDGAWISPSDALRIWNFHVDWTTPANSYFGTAGSPFVPTYTLTTTNVDPTLCTPPSPCINQPGTTVNLDDLADRLMNRLQYRNFGSYQTLVGNHTVDTNSPAGRAGIHWFELRNAGSAWAINQQGVYGPADTTSTSRWMGSIAMDGSGNIALGYSITDNVSLYPSIRYVGRLSTDAAGTLPQSETTLVTGGGYQNDSYSRWGDYSAMQVDPVDDCTFWYTQEYAQTSGAFNWYTRIGSFKFSQCTPLAVTMATFGAAQQGDSVLATWETVSELNNAGFNVYRGTSPAGWDTQLNATLIPSQAPGSSGGFVYTWEDRAGLVPGTTYYYWVEDVDMNGAATMHGPVSVDFTVPTAVTLTGVTASPAAGAAALPWLAIVAGAGAALGVSRMRRR